MRIKVRKLNAFAAKSSPKIENGGNPAGVVMDADLFSAVEMQAIAAKAGFSETAFIQKSDKAGFKIRFFTPNLEVDLCGHATIAAFSLLFRSGMVKEGRYSQETKAGILNVECRQNEIVFMEQNRPVFLDVIDRLELADSLGIGENSFLKNYPAQIVTTGIKDILIPIKDLEALWSINPGFSKIESISRKYGVVGYHAFTPQTLYSSTAHCRNFAPLFGIPEEAATGTSNGALACYLHKYGLVPAQEAGGMVFEQGYTMGKPSEILASLEVSDGEIKSVMVGGIAKGYEEFYISI